MPRADSYAYAIAYVRALRSRLISNEQYETLLKAKDDYEVLRYLSDTVYGSYLSEYSGRSLSLSEVDSLVFKDYYNVLRELIGARTTELARQMLEMMYMRHELSCLKSIMRLVLAGRTSEPSLPQVPLIGRFTPGYVSRLLKSRDLRQLFQEINEPQVRVIVLDRVAECEEIHSTVPAEMAIDRYYLSSLWSLTGKLENWDKEPAREIVGTEIDVANIGLILRGKFLGMSFSTIRDLAIPVRYRLNLEVDSAIEAATVFEAMQTLSSGEYGPVISAARSECERQSSLLPLELALKRHFVQRCSRAFVGYPFGIGPLLAFISLKYLEALDIRTILLGKREKKPADSLRHLLISIS
ncbi:V-type ATPase subunit [Candidatus Bathyarchaeota archaeon]|nr:V-type ATPase subunit [Candidatus Bathyarchaeota archaeon]